MLLLLPAVAGCAQSRPHHIVPDVPASDASFARTIGAHTLSPRIPGNAATIRLDGDEIFPAMLAAIRGAPTTITFTTYLYEDGPLADEVANALAERCRAGVGVNVLVDAVGSHRMSDHARTTLRRSGCHVERFRPLNPLDMRRVNRRMHRRVLVIDGRVGFTGGSGIGAKWTGNGRQPGRWRQTDVRVEGPIVRHLQARSPSSGASGPACCSAETPRRGLPGGSRVRARGHYDAWRRRGAGRVFEWFLLPLRNQL